MSLFDDAPTPPRKRATAPKRPAAPQGPQVVTVGVLTAEIARRLSSLGRVAVEGEVGSLKAAGSGHIYFSLKDSSANLSCVVWRSRVTPELRSRLKEGAKVVCHGTLDVYKPRGSYSLIVDRVEQRGIGELLARLEVLKSELREKGYFDRCRPLPKLPRVVGVVTSRDADAWRDFLRTRSLRFPLYPVRLRHTRVQGPGASQEVAEAIADLDRSGVDVICVVRGGGSIEDLWAFNELPVAEAVWRASVPVISGVGHETDTTLIDLVADHRAHTPTNAAELALPDREALSAGIERAGGYLSRAMDRQLDERERRLEDLARRKPLRDGGGPIAEREASLQRLRRRLELSLAARTERDAGRLGALDTALARRSPAAWLERSAGRLDQLATELQRGSGELLQQRVARLDVLERALGGVSPLAVLGRGYSITRFADGRVLQQAAAAQPGDELETLLGTGSIQSTVTKARKA